MIPRVRNVDTLILANHLEQTTYKFRKIMFHKNRQYLLLYQNEHYKILRTRYDEEFLRLVEISNEEYKDLKDLGWLQFDTPKYYSNSKEGFWVTGICFNKSENENRMTVEYILSSIERPLDILPYIVQTGVEHVFFSE